LKGGDKYEILPDSALGWPDSDVILVVLKGGEKYDGLVDLVVDP